MAEDRLVHELKEVEFPLGLCLAIVTGCLYAAAANLVSYVTHEAKFSGKERSKRALFFVDVIAFIGYVVGGLIITVAYASGSPAVPVTNATMVATNLVANMFLQKGLGITHYTKSMRGGTWTFLIAVAHMAYDGPSARGEVDVAALMARRQSVAWFAVLGVLMVLSLCVMQLYRNDEMDSMRKIFAWSMLISIMGSGTDNVASTFGLLQDWLLFTVMGAYGLVSLFLLMLSSKAPAYCEASVYVPLQLCCQMLLNMLTGMIVWQDQDRTEHIFPYLLDFMLAAMSVYLASDNVDLFAGVTHWQVMHQSLSRSRFGRSVISLLESWHEEHGSPTSLRKKKAADVALRDFLSAGLSRGIFDADGIANLVVEVHKELGTAGASVPVVQWIEDNALFDTYMSGHHEFAESVRETLPPHERERLRQRSFDSDSNPDISLTDSELSSNTE